MINQRASRSHRILQQGTLAIERLPLAYIVIDRQHRVNEWNPAAENIFGYTKQEALGKNCLDLLLPSPLTKHVQEVVRRVWKGDLNAHSVNENLTKDGRTITCEWSNTPICDPRGKVAGVMCLGQDITASKRTEQMLESTQRRYQAIFEGERARLARELHDEIGQVLSSIRLNLCANLAGCNCETRTHLEDSVSIVDSAIQQVRNLSLDLRPSMLDDLGLVATLRWTADQQARRANFKLDFAAESTGERLPPDLEIACYRVAQEALTNIGRHAHAANVSFEFCQQLDRIDIVICDDGAGFKVKDVQQRIAQGASFGVRGMQERAELLGGKFGITSSLGTGTTIHVRIPFEH